MLKTYLTLKIGGVVIVFKSRFPMAEPKKQGEFSGMERFSSYIYRGRQRAQILLAIHVQAELPKVSLKDTIFVTRHPLDNKENWRLLERGGRLIYSSSLEGRRIVVFLNSRFDRAEVFLGPTAKNLFEWNPLDVIYDFLQVLLLNYLARHKKGVILHASGARDAAGDCFLFLGRSGRGKSTIARIWDRHTSDKILNDDRVIVLKKKNGFVACGSPWHGDYFEYLDEGPLEGALRVLFFLDHGRRHKAVRLSQAEGFKRLYPCVFAPFWDQALLENAADLCRDLVHKVSMADLIFVNEKSVIPFVRHWISKK